MTCMLCLKKVDMTDSGVRRRRSDVIEKHDGRLSAHTWHGAAFLPLAHPSWTPLVQAVEALE